jgi:hypothetical protein
MRRSGPRTVAFRQDQQPHQRVAVIERRIAEKGCKPLEARRFVAAVLLPMLATLQAHDRVGTLCFRTRYDARRTRWVRAHHLHHDGNRGGCREHRLDLGFEARTTFGLQQRPADRSALILQPRTRDSVEARANSFLVNGLVFSATGHEEDDPGSRSPLPRLSTLEWFEGKPVTTPASWSTTREHLARRLSSCAWASPFSRCADSSCCRSDASFDS